MRLYVVLHAGVIVASLDFQPKDAMLIILVIGWRLKFCNYLFIVLWPRYSTLLFCQLHGCSVPRNVSVARWHQSVQ